MKQTAMTALFCLGVGLGLGGCSNPLDRLDRVEDVAPDQDTPVAAALPSAEDTAPRGVGLFARLRSAVVPTPDGAAPPAADPLAVAEAAGAALLPAKEGDVTPVLATASEVEDDGGRGVLSWLRRQKGTPEQDRPTDMSSLPQVVDASHDPAADTISGAADTARIQTASLSPKTGWGLFKRKPKAVKPAGIPFGSHVPLGEVGVVCDAPKGKLGELVAQHPEKRPTYRMYDSNPGNKVVHAFYITGFADGCVRQVTASVAVFGSVTMHEQLRYGLPDAVHPYSDTDKAYEKVKRRFCGVGAKKPCGDKLAALEKHTVFVSLYDSFGFASSWSNLLLHDGAVMARDYKTAEN